MNRDPREYRLYAMQCAEMAADARTPQLKTTFLELSAQWAKLAGGAEFDLAVLAQDGDDPLVGLPSRYAGLH